MKKINFLLIVILICSFATLSMGKVLVMAQTEPSSGSVLFYTNDLEKDQYFSSLPYSSLYSYSDTVPSPDGKATYVAFSFDTGVKTNIKADEFGNNYYKTGNTYTFFTADSFINKNGIITEIGYATTTLEKFTTEYFDKEIISFKWITPVNAQNSNSNADGDGQVRNSNANYNTARTATDGTTAYKTEHSITAQNTYAGGNYYIDRIFLPFDTSALSDTECISSSTLSIYVAYNEGANDYYDLATSTQANGDNITTADYDQIGGFDLAPEVEIGSTGYKYFNLSYLDIISTSSYTKLAIRQDGDTDGETPSDQRFMQINSANEEGTVYDPLLMVETEACEEPPVEATSTVPFSVEGLNYSWDLTIIAGMTEHYESTTTAPDWVEISYYHIPFFFWVILFLITVFIFYRVIIELLIRFRKK